MGAGGSAGSALSATLGSRTSPSSSWPCSPFPAELCSWQDSQAGLSQRGQGQAASLANKHRIGPCLCAGRTGSTVVRVGSCLLLSNPWYKVMLPVYKLPSQSPSGCEAQGDSRTLTLRSSSAWPANVARLLWALPSWVTAGCFKGDLLGALTW